MKKKLVNSQLCNYNTYMLYRREMVSLAENVFEFKNLPEFIDVAYLNKTLLKQGSIAFFKDDVLGVIALPYDVLGSLDIYGRPKQIMARAFNGRYFRKLKEGETTSSGAKYKAGYDTYVNANGVVVSQKKTGSTSNGKRKQYTAYDKNAKRKLTYNTGFAKGIF